MQLAGRVAVVTGASRGLGESIARRLAGEGMVVVAAARSRDRLQRLAESQPGVQPAELDVADESSIRALAKQVEQDHGACHVLVNNAGIPQPTFTLRDDEDLEALRRTMQINVDGLAACMVAFRELLERSAPARVINVASMAGKLGVGHPGYTASKFAVVGLSEAADLDWSRRGVRVSQLNPGFVRTEGFPQDDLMGMPVVRRLVGHPEQVARAAEQVARYGLRERTVPRWYRPLTTMRHTLGPAFWAITRRLPLT